MKRAFATLALATLVLGSACRNWDNPFDPANRPPNRPPNAPAEPRPRDGATRQDTGLVLFWIGGDSDSADTVVYDVYFGTGAEPGLLVTAVESTAQRPGRLDFSTEYSWKVVSRDNHGDSTIGPVWSFSTWAQNDSNRPPHVPSGPNPTDQATQQDTNLVFSWTGDDPDSGDDVGYDLYLGTAAAPPLVRSGLDSNRYRPGNLAPAARYYWKVVAHDNHWDTASGPVWSFATIGMVVNHPPFEPSNPSPGNGATGVSRRAALSWFGGDPDPGDSVRYDVYFGVDLNLARIAQDYPTSSYPLSGLGYGTEYYWKIVSRDRQGETIAGQIWHFRTMGRVVVTEPQAGAKWRMGSEQTIVWTGGDRWDGRLPTKRVTLRKVGLSSTAVTVRGRTGFASSATSSWEQGRLRKRASERGLGSAAGVDSTVVFHSADSGRTWQRHGRATVAGRYDWIVPGPPTGLALVQVRAYAEVDCDTGTSGLFEVTDTVRPSPIAVTSPVTGDRWEIGTDHPVTWTGGTARIGSLDPRRVDSTGGWLGVDSSVVYYSSNGGTAWRRQGRAETQGVFDWRVPGPATSQAKIQIRAYGGSDSSVGSSGGFVVTSGRYPDSVVTTVTVGQEPAAMAWNSEEDRICVANYGSNSATIIGGSSNAPEATLEVGSFPAAVTYVRNLDKFYVADYGSRSVTVIDGASNTVVGTVSVGSAPRELAWDSTDNKVYVANYGTGANSVSVIDATQDTVIATVAVGERPRAVVWNPVSNRVYVACYAENKVRVIDPAVDTVVAVVAVGAGPCFLAVDTDRNEVYVANLASGYVTVINGATNQVITTVGVGGGQCALAWNRTSDKVYAVLVDGSSVAVINATSHQMVTEVTVGERPQAIVWTDDMNMAYVANNGSNDVTIVNGVTNQVERTLDVGAGPVAVIWNPRSNKVYVANNGGSTVSVIGARQ